MCAIGILIIALHIEIYCLWHQADTVATVSPETVEIFHIYSVVLLYVKMILWHILLISKLDRNRCVCAICVRSCFLCKSMCECVPNFRYFVPAEYSSDLYLFYLKWHMGKCFNWNKCWVKWSARMILFSFCACRFAEGKKYTASFYWLWC